MYKIWPITDKHSSRIIPKNQPVVSDGKLYVGNGRDVFDNLHAIGSDSNVVRKRLGPYRVNFDDDGLNVGSGVILSPELPAGSILEMVWLEGVEHWASDAEAPDDAWLNITAVSEDGFQGMAYYAVGTPAISQMNDANIVLGLPLLLDVLISPVRLKLPATIGVYAESDPTWTAGASDLFILYSEPA